MSEDIAQVFKNLGKYNKAKLIGNCNTLKYVQECIKNPNHQEIRASYCRDRFCPICSHLKAHKQTQMMHSIFEKIRKDNNCKNSYLLFATLTQKNVTIGELKDSVDKTTRALTKLMREDELFKTSKTKKKRNGKLRTVTNKPLCQGAIIKKECTVKRNKKGQIEFNNHIHLILMVRKDYWNQKSKQWSQKSLQAKWKAALGLDYDPVVWISLVRNLEEIVKDDVLDPKEAKNIKNNIANLNPSGALKEISKYQAKESDLLPINLNSDGTEEIDWDLAEKIVNEMYIGYYGKETISYTGEFRNKKKLYLDNAKAKEIEDLIEQYDGKQIIDLFKKKTCKKCGAPMEERLERYGNKTKSYYVLSNESLERYKIFQNQKFNVNLKKYKKKSDESYQLEHQNY